MSTISLLLPAGKLLTLTADVFTSGSITQLSESVGGEPLSPVAIAVSSTTEFGAFAKDRRYDIISNGGEIGVSITASSGKFGSDLSSTGDLSITGDTQDPTTDTNIGTVGTGITAVENGDGKKHVTTLTLSTELPPIAGGANLAVGKLLYTFPAGAIIINHAYMEAILTESEGNVTADTPDVGIGTVIASGAVALLGGTATFENIVTGQTATNVDGTLTIKTSIPTAGVPFVIESAEAHTVHLNVADGWAAGGDNGIFLVGTVIIDWSFIV